ncbi:MAG: ATP-binding cassette domain-containing protein, partial [Lacisediminimonas sp.]|nr:ATP-binding cassette domain-containing protein [Lacisediminimonas sp.]
MNNALLQAQGLQTFYGVSHILHHVDFSIAPGETVALMGRNGMGKSTLIRSMLGLVRPREGTVKVRGEDMTKAEPHVIAR